MMQGSARNEKPQPWGRGFFFRLGCASRSVGFRPSSEPHRKFSPVASPSPLEWRAPSAPFKDQFLHARISSSAEARSVSRGRAAKALVASDCIQAVSRHNETAAYAAMAAN